ncbi:hypothetical protein ACHAWF_014941, partial [Thalassiosira exigua]
DGSGHSEKYPTYLPTAAPVPANDEGEKTRRPSRRPPRPPQEVERAPPAPEPTGSDPQASRPEAGEQKSDPQATRPESEPKTLHYPDWIRSKCAEADSSAKEAWETGFESDEECCRVNFGWDKDGACYAGPEEPAAAETGEGEGEDEAEETDEDSDETGERTDEDGDEGTDEEGADESADEDIEEGADLSNPVSTIAMRHYADWESRSCILADSTGKKAWEVGYDDDAECCRAHFGWDEDGDCYDEGKYGTVAAGSDAEGDGGDVEETESDAANYAADGSGEVADEDKEKDEDEEKDAVGQASKLMYYADWELKGCTQQDSSAKKSWEVGYSSGDECCRANFAWVEDGDCYDADEHGAVASGDEGDGEDGDASVGKAPVAPVYRPDFDRQVCVLDDLNVQDHVQGGYESEAECCEAHSWRCGGAEAEAGVGAEGSTPAPIPSEDSVESLEADSTPAYDADGSNAGVDADGDGDGDVGADSHGPFDDEADAADGNIADDSEGTDNVDSAEGEVLYYANFNKGKCKQRNSSAMSRFDVSYATERKCCIANGWQNNGNCLKDNPEETDAVEETDAAASNFGSTGDPSESPTPGPTFGPTPGPTHSAPSTSPELSPSGRPIEAIKEETAWPTYSPTPGSALPLTAAPSQNPTREPTTEPTIEPTTAEPTDGGEIGRIALSCPSSLDGNVSLESAGSLMRYALVPSDPPGAGNGLLCVHLEVETIGWVGFGLSEGGSMIGSDAVVGLPDEGTVLKYELGGKSDDQVVAMSGERQTLMDTSVVQEEGKTVVKFAKLLVENGEVPILEEGTNHFLLAVGGSNDLYYHMARLSFEMDFGEDEQTAYGNDAANTADATPTPAQATDLAPDDTASADLSPTIDPEEQLMAKLRSVSPLSSDGLDDETSNQYRAMQWLLGNADYDVYSDARRVQRWALAMIYRSMYGAEWIVSDGWMNDKRETGHECTWHGITCHEDTEVVTSIDLSENSLLGQIPVEIVLLENLETLTLTMNFISAIPTELFGMNSLKVIDLDKNLLEEIPSGISSTNSNLEALYLSNNQLQDIPDGLFPQLRQLKVLWLSNNRIASPLPSGLGSMTMLEELDLESNLFSGTIPPELYSLSNLHTLLLHDNQLEGTFSSSFSGMTNLKILDLDGNHISGELPSEIGRLGQLSELHLGGNKMIGQIPWANLCQLGDLTNLDISGNNLNSTIGPEIGCLSNLVSLRLNGNYKLNNDGTLISHGIMGPIPGSIGNLRHLQELRLDNNYVGGALPATLGNLQNLTTLRIESNNLQSSIPSELGNLSNLQYLHLWSNYLTSTISGQLGKLSQLQELFLDDNELTGTIPPELGQLTNAVYISLAENRLEGAIPPTFGMLSSLGRLDLQFNGLYGEIPLQMANLGIARLKLEGNDFFGSIPDGICDNNVKVTANCDVPEEPVNSPTEQANMLGLAVDVPTPSPTFQYWWSCNCCANCYPGK